MMYDDLTEDFTEVDCKLYPGKKCTTHFEPCFMDYIAQKFWRKKILEVVKPPKQELINWESAYEVTLTTTKDDPYELRQWIQKIAKSAMYEVIDMPYCIELTQAGLPHIHAILYSKKKFIDGTKIKKLKFPYRYECKRVKDLAAYKNYIIKEKNNPIIIEYCLKKGISQFSNAKDNEIREPEIEVRAPLAVQEEANP